ncbi:hypothetical protein, partial [Methylobacterium ajmalii]|uniref:hypothetical protein n=1 Tax=Methylobacterium ajmalii TaxID=2738439 RepID=UPI00190B812D
VLARRVGGGLGEDRRLGLIRSAGRPERRERRRQVVVAKPREGVEGDGLEHGVADAQRGGLGPAGEETGEKQR